MKRIVSFMIFLILFGTAGAAFSEGDTSRCEIQFTVRAFERDSGYFAAFLVKLYKWSSHFTLLQHPAYYVIDARFEQIPNPMLGDTKLDFEIHVQGEGGNNEMYRKARVRVYKTTSTRTKSFDFDLSMEVMDILGRINTACGALFHGEPLNKYPEVAFLQPSRHFVCLNPNAMGDGKIYGTYTTAGGTLLCPRIEPCKAYTGDEACTDFSACKKARSVETPGGGREYIWGWEEKPK